MSETFDVIVIGGGVIGMSTAWEIGKTGRSVLLLEQGTLGQEASQAAAGMLGAQLEVANDGDFFRLCVESRGLYDTFSQELYDQTGMDIQLTHNGILHLAQTEDEISTLHHRAKWQQEAGCETHWWQPEEVATREKALNKTMGALLLPSDSNILAPALTQALSVAVLQVTTVQQGAQVYYIKNHIDYTEVTTNSGSYRGEHVVIAAGAWAERLLSQVNFAFHVYPVKGQMCLIRPSNGLRLEHTVFSDHAYLVPKKDGTIVVGATEDHHSGFNKQVTASATAILLAALQRIAPDLADSPLERVWAGLRPGTTDCLPVLGALPNAHNTWVAAGHFRNGILLAPITAKMALAHIETRRGPEYWYAFAPDHLKIPV